MSGWRALLRGLWWRRGLSAMVLAVAVLAAAAATTGPLYYSAARASILRDNVHAGLTVQQGVEIIEQGPLPGLLEQLTGNAELGLAHAPAKQLLATTVRGLEAPFSLPKTHQVTTLVWREGACARLIRTAGRCPGARNEVMASQALMRLNRWRIGQRLPQGLTVVGAYRPREVTERYWSTRGYFPQQGSIASVSNGPEPVDALIAARATLDGPGASRQGVALVDRLLDLDGIQPADMDPLRATLAQLSQYMATNQSSAYVQTGIASVLDDTEASWTALLVPVFLITAQLLVLVWLLLFLVTTDAVEARGNEVALAKLRGFSRWQVLRLGLAEPLLLLALALPVGALLGWAATGSLARVALRSGTPVPLVAGAWGAAGIAVAGGVLAAALAARRTLTRPVLEQWQRLQRAGAGRTWVVDAAVLTAALAGLAQLLLSGTVAATSRSVLALLVPGLLAVAVAVTASRLLPLACRAAYGWTRSRGGVAGFVAVRQVARRPGGTRTTIVLSAAFALAAFAVSAWSVSRANIHDVAATGVGAPTVLDVVPPPDADLSRIVDRLDPGGAQAMAVTSYVDFGNDAQQTFAVDPERFARIATWRPDFSSRPVADLAAQLSPPAPPPARFDGDRLRISVRTHGLLARPKLHLGVVLDTGSSAPYPRDDIGDLRPGVRTLTTDLPGCPCSLRRLSLSARSGYPAVAGTLVVTGVSVHTPSGWRPVAAGLRQGELWQWESPDRALQHEVSAGPEGLTLRFAVPEGVEAAVDAYSWPTPVPALISASLLPGTAGDQASVIGLDRRPLPVRPVAVVPVPGAPTNGAVVDATYAERASYGVAFDADHQVWLAADADPAIPQRLEDAGVTVVGTETTQAAADQQARQGPALALVLFLADAAAAAVLAAAGAVLALFVSGRRRGYELAALQAAGAPRRSLRRSLLVEQGLTLGFGTVVGVATGWAAALLALPSVPEFVRLPAAPPLRYVPDPAVLLVLLGVAVAALAAAAVAGTLTLVARVRADQLREGAA